MISIGILALVGYSMSGCASSSPKLIPSRNHASDVDRLTIRTASSVGGRGLEHAMQFMRGHEHLDIGEGYSMISGFGWTDYDGRISVCKTINEDTRLYFSYSGKTMDCNDFDFVPKGFSITLELLK